MGTLPLFPGVQLGNIAASSIAPSVTEQALLEAALADQKKRERELLMINQGIAPSASQSVFAPKLTLTLTPQERAYVTRSILKGMPKSTLPSYSSVLAATPFTTFDATSPQFELEQQAREQARGQLVAAQAAERKGKRTLEHSIAGMTDEQLFGLQKALQEQQLKTTLAGLMEQDPMRRAQLLSGLPVPTPGIEQFITGKQKTAETTAQQQAALKQAKTSILTAQQKAAEEQRREQIAANKAIQQKIQEAQVKEYTKQEKIITDEMAKVPKKLTDAQNELRATVQALDAAKANPLSAFAANFGAGELPELQQNVLAKQQQLQFMQQESQNLAAQLEALRNAIQPIAIDQVGLSQFIKPSNQTSKRPSNKSTSAYEEILKRKDSRK